MLDSKIQRNAFALLLAALFAASCAGLKPALSLQAKVLALAIEPSSMLSEVLPDQAKRWGAEIVPPGQQSDLSLAIKQEQCRQTALTVSGRSARGASYELHCRIEFSVVVADDSAITDSINVRDTYLYDSGDSTAAQFPARDNELQLLRKSLAEEAALVILQRLDILLMANE